MYWSFSNTISYLHLKSETWPPDVTKLHQGSKSGFAHHYTLDDDSECSMDYELSLLPKVFP